MRSTTPHNDEWMGRARKKQVAVKSAKKRSDTNHAALTKTPVPSAKHCNWQK
jgi:hypothetical protein